MTTAVPGLVKGSPENTELLRRSISGLLRRTTYTAKQRAFIVAEVVAQMSANGAYVNHNGKLNLPELTRH